MNRRYGCIQEDGSAKDMRKTLCMQLWDHAVQLYDSREYRASDNFYFSAMNFTDRGSDDWLALDEQCQRIYDVVPELFRSAHWPSLL